MASSYRLMGGEYLLIRSGRLCMMVAGKPQGKIRPGLVLTAQGAGPSFFDNPSNPPYPHSRFAHRSHSRGVVLMRLAMTLIARIAWMFSVGFCFSAEHSLAANASAPPSPTVSKAIEAFIKKQEIAGAVTLVAGSERTVALNVAGFADVEQHRPMQPDTIFWIASMTKPITATAIMMLESEGKLSVEDPVGKYIPAMQSLETPDGKPAQVTIRHLLTHTSGMAEITQAQARGAATLADVIPLYAEQKLKFSPGEKWAYCQSGINTAARVVEVVSGKTFPQFLSERLFEPLGMKDTTFYLTDDQLRRLATSYRRTGEDKLEPSVISFLGGTSPTSHDRFPAGNGGLFSTAPDYVKFCQMILQGGEFDGRRYLSRQAVEKMTSLQTGDLKTGFTPGNGWGLGWCVVREPQGVTEMLSAGSFGHGGAFGTQAWIDPGKRSVYILMVQRANFPNSDASDVRRAFQEAAAKIDLDRSSGK
jgi:CubicO group peptidase (beta-lactamase class C family)